MPKKSMTVLTIALSIAMIFAMAVPAHALKAGAVAFNATATLPDFPCDDAGGCDVTALGGDAFGAIAGTGPNGVTVCAAAAAGCAIGLGPAGIHYDEPPCVANEPIQGSASGQVQITGGLSVAAPQTPAILNINYVRIGVIAVITFTGGQLGAAVGVFVPGAGADCIPNNGPATVRVVGIGAVVDP